MPNTNHGLAYRPLMAGVAIYNPNVNEVGTLGLIATSDGTDRWIVSCYHVLARNLSAVVVIPFASGESIFQGSAHDGVVAQTDVGRADAQVDCAAALIDSAVVTLQAIVDVGLLNTAPVPPAVGLRCLKAGADTGVTEGVVRRIEQGRVLIGPPNGFPIGYVAAGRGDSGSLWVTADTRQPVAMHLGVRSTDGVAVAVPIGTVLTTLRLHTV